MIGKIVLDGDCEDCKVAELNIQRLYSNSGIYVNYVVCEHENACRHMKLKYMKQQEEDKSAL